MDMEGFHKVVLHEQIPIYRYNVDFRIKQHSNQLLPLFLEIAKLAYNLHHGRRILIRLL